MKILVLCHYGIHENTPRSFRTLELIKALKNDKYDIDLLEGKYKRFTKNINVESTEDEVSSYSERREKKFKQIRKLGSYVLNYLFGDMVILKCYLPNLNLVSSEKYDVVISIGQPFYPHMISAKLNNGNIVKIADCGDPFYIENSNMGKHIEQLQKFVLNKMDYITIPVESAKSYYRKYVPDKKIKVIPQGVDFSSFDTCEYRKNDVPTFAYAGVFYDKIRDPRFFLQYLIDCKKEYKFILYTDISNPFYLEKIKPIVEASCGRIVVGGLISRNRCIKELSTMDFVINFENNSKNQSPSKLIDYGIAGRPVLSFSEKTFDSDIFNQFLEGNYTDRLYFDISQYDINNVKQKFEMLFERPLQK